MFKKLAFCLMLVFAPCSIMANEVLLNGEDDIIEHWYAEVCPYGDAVITDLNKNGISETSCVTYNYRTGMWDTWQGDVDRRRNFKSYDPKKVRVWVMDGELSIKNKHPEVKFYGVRTIDDPKFVEWLKTH